ncbi:MAG: spore coat protein CotJB [Candidatus Paraimprobicoccus trichonymphae]|uniref:Spore coat protein CotJB n=1 Tax=Candidatus Paraimprobicoccus trichonymphae TaxID=3033793 RepID=A0AA48KXZ1_9FIRM|nr:MAG: spore coat protein CotJB [Candidatus Paraimprobicoccus trichonymphae]
MTDKERLLRRISSLDFAVVELNLYLDTHQNAIEVKNKLQEYKKKSEKLKKDYEKRFGAITSTTDSNVGNAWEWVSDPWPWENDETEENDSIYISGKNINLKENDDNLLNEDDNTGVEN